MILLKRLENAIADRDTIDAVIRSVAINNDGNNKMSYSAPSVPGQEAAIREALEIAGVEPETIGYVETHGTGTKLGDPIEMAALINIFGRNKEKKCAIGSVKANIGHLDAAAGMAGLLKVTQALKNK